MPTSEIVEMNELRNYLIQFDDGEITDSQRKFLREMHAEEFKSTDDIAFIISRLEKMGFHKVVGYPHCGKLRFVLKPGQRIKKNNFGKFYRVAKQKGLDVVPSAYENKPDGHYYWGFYIARIR